MMLGRGNLEWKLRGEDYTQDNLRRQAQLVKRGLQLVKPGKEQSDGCQMGIGHSQNVDGWQLPSQSQKQYGKVGARHAVLSYCCKWLVDHRRLGHLWRRALHWQGGVAPPVISPCFSPSFFASVVVRQACSSLVEIMLGRNESF